MSSTALAPRGLASGTVGKLAGMVRICSIGLIGSQVLARECSSQTQWGWAVHSDALKIESVPLERVLHEEAV